MKWFRFYHEFVDDPKIAMMSDSDQLLWVKALCLASESNVRGIILLTDEEICWKLRCTVETWKHAVDKFRAKGMIQHVESGYQIVNWDNRQFESDSSASRVARHRAKKNKVTETEQQQLCNVTVTPSDTDPEQKQKQIRKKNIVHSGFDDFWKLYPKKKNKGQAEKAYKARMNEGHDHGLICKRLEYDINHEWKGRDAQYIPYGATWLNGKDWTDDEWKEQGEPSTLSQIAIELSRLNKPVVLPQAWQERTGLRLMSELSQQQAVEYLEFLRALEVVA